MDKDEFRKMMIEHLDEYIGEAENQEGKEYWNRYPDLVKDFGVYLQNLD